MSDPYVNIATKVLDTLKTTKPLSETEAFISIVRYGRVDGENRVYSGYSYRDMMRMWRWPNHMKVKRFLLKLQDLGLIVLQQTSKNVTVTVLNTQGKTEEALQSCYSKRPHNTIRNKYNKNIGSFEAFWKQWMSEHRKVARKVAPGSKALALQEWNKLTVDEQERAMVLVDSYFAFKGEYPKGAQGYLKNQDWLAIPEKTKADKFKGMKWQ